MGKTWEIHGRSPKRIIKFSRKIQGGKTTWNRSVLEPACISSTSR
jgi:hypothetical protein